MPRANYRTCANINPHPDTTQITSLNKAQSFRQQLLKLTEKLSDKLGLFFIHWITLPAAL